MFFKSFQYLETIKFYCEERFFSEKDLFDVVANYSPKNICKLELTYPNSVRPELLPEELESFFVSWKNHIPQKLLSLTYSFSENDENKKVIEKYVKLGVVKIMIPDE